MQLDRDQGAPSSRASSRSKTSTTRRPRHTTPTASWHAAQAAARAGAAQPVVHADPLAPRRRRGPRARAHRQPRRPGRADAAHDRLADRSDPRELPDERGRLRHGTRPLEAPRRARPRVGQEAVRDARQRRNGGGRRSRASSSFSPTAASTRTAASSSPRTARSTPSTGTIQLQALVPNPDGRPAARAIRARAHRAGPRRATTCWSSPRRRSSPSRGRTRSPSSGADNKVQLRRVEVGPSAGEHARHQLRASPRATASSSRACRRFRRRAVDRQTRAGALVRERAVRRAERGAATAARARDVRAFFIRRPIVAMVIAILTVLSGVVSLLGLPIAQFPQILPPQVNLTTTYTGRRRAHDRAVGRDAHRAADERRRPDALHPVDERERRVDEPGA